MTSEPRAFFAIDHGAASTTAALIGHLGGRWRLLASGAVPATVPLDPLLMLLASRVASSDPDALSSVARSRQPQPEAVVDWPRLEARSSPPAVLAVLAGTARRLDELELAATRAGWIVEGGSADVDEPMALGERVLDERVSAVLLGAGDPPGSDERPGLAMLGALVAGMARRRPELRIVLSGGAADLLATVTGAAGGTDGGSPHAGALGTAEGLPGVARPGMAATGSDVLLAPAASAGQPAGLSLTRLLGQLRALPDDSRRAIARTIASLAMVIDRRVEAIEIGHDGGLFVRAAATGEGHASVESTWIASPSGALVPPEPGDDVLDGVLRWSVHHLDRHRLGDLLRELRADPWGRGDGEGALLRLAAARAAACRVVDLVPEFGRLGAPDLIVATGGAWATCPPPAIALALADTVRRPGTSQLALDHARLLAPLGTIEDEGELRRLLLDLVDDLLIPLATVIAPRGLRTGRSAGRFTLHGAGPSSEIDLQPGGIELVDLPPGLAGTAELEFREAVDLGVRGRHFETAVAGGLGGLLLDLRDVPLRVPDRGERRRAALAAWHEAVWMEHDA